MEYQPNLSNIKPGNGGVIQRVEPGSTGAQLGLQPGDAILRVNGATMRDVIDFRFAMTEERIDLTVRQAGPGRLDAVLTSRTTASLPTNDLRSLQIGAPENATAVVNGTIPLQAGVAVSLAAGTQQVTVTVQRVGAGPFRVPLTVTDGCGVWRTFVGGGAGVS